MTDNIAPSKRASVQAQVRDGAQERIGLVLWLAGGGEVLSPWWSTRRDKELRAFWKNVDHLAGAVYALESRMATIPFRVVPVDKSIEAHGAQAERFDLMMHQAAQFGKGWPNFYAKWTQDLLTQDVGTFAEIIGMGNPSGPIVGMPLSIAHLDAARCTRTSDPEYPVIYQASDGKRHKMHFTRVAYASLQESPDTDMNGVGFCSISRCINVAQNILDVLVYNQEKLGSRPHRNILLAGGGLDPDDVVAAFTMAAETMDNQLLSRYSKSVVIGDTGIPDATLESIDLSSLPDGFSYTESMTIGMACVALAFGVDARELWPLTGIGATRADALVQHLKARQKGIGHLLQIAESSIGQKMLPPTLYMQFDYQDDAEDRMVSEIKEIRSRRHDIDLKNFSVDERVVREQMLASGDLTQAQFEQLELKDGRMEDGTPVLSLFFNPEFEQALSMPIPNPLDTEANTLEEVAPTLEAKRTELYEQLGNTTNHREKRMLMTSLRALDALEGAYQDKAGQQSIRDMQQTMAEGEDEEVGNEAATEDDNGEQGTTPPSTELTEDESQVD